MYSSRSYLAHSRDKFAIYQLPATNTAPLIYLKRVCREGGREEVPFSDWHCAASPEFNGTVLSIHSGGQKNSNSYNILMLFLGWDFLLSVFCVCFTLLVICVFFFVFLCCLRNWSNGCFASTEIIMNYYYYFKKRRFPCLRHEVLKGEYIYSSVIPNLGTGWMWVVNFRPRPLYPQERTPVPMERRLDGPQSRSGRFIIIIIIITLNLLSRISY